MELFNGVLYGGCHPLAGTASSAMFTCDLLVIDGAVKIPCDSLSVSIGGFNHDELFFIWSNSEGDKLSFKTSSKQDAIVAANAAPAQLVVGFQNWNKRRYWMKFVWASIVSIVVTALISSALIWWKYDEALTWVASYITIENEERLGEHVVNQIKHNEYYIQEGDAYDALVGIGNRLTDKSRYNYKWYISLDDSINAFAVPGGTVVVNAGLIMAMKTPEELAAVIAHEVQHIEQRHSLKSMLNSIGLASLLMVVLGDVNVATAIIAHQVGNLYFSRDKEEEADSLGFHLMLENNISPDGMLGLMKTLNGEAGTDIPAWISSHPQTNDRIASIESLISAHPCNTCLKLDYDWVKIQTDEQLKDKL